jgi:hypothetical protein
LSWRGCFIRGKIGGWDRRDEGVRRGGVSAGDSDPAFKANGAIEVNMICLKRGLVLVA